ncbi:MAG: hypothetical protein HY329_22315 [Chloroflexi bacterium]|nr:hypothetical protein [Chloroflexota bacterium]
MPTELDRQIENLLQKRYPQLAGISTQAFLAHVEPLRECVLALPTGGEAAPEGHIPFVLVVRRDLVAAEQALPLVSRGGQVGFTSMAADDLARFVPIEAVGVPSSLVYLVVDVDTGKETLDVTPDAALETIRAANRSPLTLDEGIALVTHFPEAVRKSHGFSLLGSRCGDRRVTAWWLSGGRPRLGWCWAGNPHTWLGSASCGGRLEAN